MARLAEPRASPPALRPICDRSMLCKALGEEETIKSSNGVKQEEKQEEERNREQVKRPRAEGDADGETG